MTYVRGWARKYSVTKRDALVQVTIRVPASWLRRADRISPSFPETGGLPATRTDVLREALRHGLELYEQEGGIKCG